MKILMVFKRSSFEVMSEDREAFAALKKRSPRTVRDLKAGHLVHRSSLDMVRRVIESAGHDLKLEDRARLAQVSWADLVVTVGGDGTLLEAARYVVETPVLAVNSDPRVSVAHFSACDASSFRKTFERLGSREVPLRRVARLQVEVDGELVRRALLNDLLLAHRNPAATTRVELKAGSCHRHDKCSGVWVSTAAGSTAAIGSAGGRTLPLLSRRWQYLVREPYRASSQSGSKGVLGPGEKVELVCGVQPARLYLDGPHRSLKIGIGSRVVVRPGAPDLKLYRALGR